MEDKYFCPTCHLANDPKSIQCKYCGASFSSRGLPTNSTASIDLQEKPAVWPNLCEEYMGEVPPGSLVLNIQSHKTPLLVQNIDTVVLGRVADDEVEQAIDLSAYDAYQLGVSRRHARIARVGDDFFLEDLESTNGTWVNNRRLPFGRTQKLSHNDIIYLGRLTIIVCLSE